MEYIIEHVAKQSKLNELDVRNANLYKKGDITPYGQPLPYFNVDTIINNLKLSLTKYLSGQLKFVFFCQISLFFL